MKKLIILVLCALLMVSSTAAAVSWNQTDPVSPYRAEIVPLSVFTNLFGQETLQRYSYGAVKNGEVIYFALRVTVPAKAVPASLCLSARGVSLNCSLSSVLPETSGQWYLNATGNWQSEYAVLRGIVTDPALASVSAEISSNAGLSDIALGDVTVQADSGGYLWSNGRSSMFFAVYGSGQVYGARVNTYLGSFKVSASLLEEDSEPGSIARYYLRTLNIDAAELLSGGVYMTPKLIRSNFGTAADTSDSFSWVGTAVLPVTTVAAVPATGMPWDVIACIFAFVCVICVVIVTVKKRR